MRADSSYFYEKFIERKGAKVENYNPSINKQDFDETMLIWKKGDKRNKGAEQELNEYVEQAGEGVRTYATLAFLDGVARDLKGTTVKEVNHIPSVDLLDHNLLTMYKDSWIQGRNIAKKTEEMVAKTEAISIIRDC